jgi:hypothetical protein
MRAQLGGAPSPQALASEPLIEDGGFAKPDSSALGAMALRGNPRNLLTRGDGVSPPNETAAESPGGRSHPKEG